MHQSFSDERNAWLFQCIYYAFSKFVRMRRTSSTKDRFNFYDAKFIPHARLPSILLLRTGYAPTRIHSLFSFSNIDRFLKFFRDCCLLRFIILRGGVPDQTTINYGKISQLCDSVMEENRWFFKFKEKLEGGFRTADATTEAAFEAKEVRSVVMPNVFQTDTEGKDTLLYNDVTIAGAKARAICIYLVDHRRGEAIDPIIYEASFVVVSLNPRAEQTSLKVDKLRCW